MEIETEDTQREAEAREFEKNYLRDRIADNTGERIRWRDEILELLADRAESLYIEVLDQYYWDDGFSVGPLSGLSDQEDSWQHLFSVACNVCENSHLEVQVLLSINDDMDEDSSLSLRCMVCGQDGEEEAFSAVIHYHNGSGYEDDLEGTVELESVSNLDDSEAESFIEDLKGAISELNPYVAQIEALEYEAARHGGSFPVAEFPCWECGKTFVSLSDEFYPFGHCCYCGSDNEVSICERCGNPFSSDNGHDGICDACWEDYDKE